jgi:hypothetical protein
MAFWGPDLDLPAADESGLEGVMVRLWMMLWRKLHTSDYQHNGL